MKKKILSIVLAGTMAASVAATGAIAVSADEVELAPGGYGTLGEYTPGADTNTNRLMFAMPAAWQNDTTKDERCGGAAGIYWWGGSDTPDDKAGGHGWPGYKAKKVEEEGVDNLWAIDVPTYGNGESGDSPQVIWNNYLDGGMERDPAKNPFYDAANQTKDLGAQYYSRTDDHETYDILFRYIYKKVMVDEGVNGADALDLKGENFWEDANKLAAASLGKSWDDLSSDEKTYQVDEVLDAAEVDLSEFGDYASNFFNEDLADELYPLEESQGFGESFLFNNMVFVVNFDPEKMIPSPQSGKIGYDGEFYFYYGGGEYGSWPTKELNTKMKEELGEEYAVEGNFTQGTYVDPNFKPEVPTTATEATDPATTTIPAPATDATSGTSGGTSGSGNTSNGAIATGQISFAVIVFVVLIAGVGAVYFTRKRRED